MKNANKFIGLCIATAIFSCQKPDTSIDDVSLDINIPAASTVIGFQFVDADSGEEIKSLDALITGSGSKRIGTIDLKQPAGNTYKPQEEFFSLAVIPNEANEPTEGNPLKFNVKLPSTNTTYLQPSSTIELTSKGEYYFKIPLKKNIASGSGDAGVIIAKGSAADTSGFQTLPNVNGNTARIKFESGSGSATLRYIDVDDTIAKRSFPDVTLKGANVYTTIAGLKLDASDATTGEATIELNSDKADDIFTLLDNKTDGAELVLYEETTDADGNVTWEEAKDNERVNGKLLPRIYVVGRRFTIRRITNKFCRIVIRTTNYTSPIASFPSLLSPELGKLIVTATAYDRRGKIIRVLETSLADHYKNYFYLLALKPRAIVYRYKGFYLSTVSLSNQLLSGPSLIININTLNELFKLNTVKSLMVAGTCPKSTIRPNGILLYKLSGTTKYEYLGKIVNGAFSTNILENGKTYDFRMDYDGASYYKKDEFMSSTKLTYSISVAIKNEVCKTIN